MNTKTVLPAEWHPQSGVMLTWPHEYTDWAYMLDEVEACFINIATEILKRELLLVVCVDTERIESLLGDHPNLMIAEMPTNDTWARDHGAITVLTDGKPMLLDFKFNGWGLKFAADKDNLITQRLYNSGLFQEEVAYSNCLNVALEGGSIESDGKGTILTTAECLLSPNRNGEWNQTDIESYFAEKFGATRVLWLNHGYLAGDDTDSHVDTLARLCDETTIAYVKCTDPDDEHYDELAKMEQELMQFKTAAGEPYRLIALPMADAVYDEDERIPATYANFLIINNAVLIPSYDSPMDAEAAALLKQAFTDREMVLIDCRSLIKQHGSLHCVTMQFPEGVL